MELQVEEPKEFRVYAKELFLTYPQVPENLTAESVLDQLQKRVPFVEYVASTERHEDGGKHFHLVLFLRDFRSTAPFQVKFKGKAYKNATARESRGCHRLSPMCAKREITLQTYFVFLCLLQAAAARVLAQDKKRSTTELDKYTF